MNRSVVTHHRTAWCRSQRATSRWTAGSVSRRRSGRGGNRVAWATPAWAAAPPLQLQPDQKAIGQHDRHGRPVAANPQAPLVLVPPQLPLGLFMELLHRLPPMGIAGQLLQGGRRRQITPEVLALLGRPPRGALTQQPAHVPLAVAGHPPTPDDHPLLAPPACGALPPANRPPRPAGDAVEQRLRPQHRAARGAPDTHPNIRRTPTTDPACRASRPGRQGGLSPESASATTQRRGTPHARA